MDDMLVDILARLPVKSLIRSKCVCKAWRDIITNPSFISLHLANSRTGKRIRSDTCGGVSVRSRGDWMGNEEGNPEHVYDFMKIHIPGSNGIDRLHTCDTYIDAIPYEAPYGAAANTVEHIPYSIVGYCDGIFCLSWRQLYRDMPGYYPREPESSPIGEDFSRHPFIALCNPAIRELRVVPMSDSDFPPYRRREAVDVGFGYDPKTNDYKVVKILSFLDSRGLVDFLEVYSLKTNSWQNVVIRGNHRYPALQQVRAHALDVSIYTNDGDGSGGGVLHWSMWRGYGEFLIVSFLMDDYSLRVTRGTPSRYAWIRTPMKALLHNKLALVGYCSPSYDAAIEVLVMNNYELDDDSWSHVATVKSPLSPGRPLGFWKDNVLLMFGLGHPFLFDIAQTQTQEEKPLRKFAREMDFFYTETLVSVKPQHRDPGFSETTTQTHE